jgi:GNAT superfamily N-acetyltransferase
MSSRRRIEVRNTTPTDFAGIIALTEATYPGSPPWQRTQLDAHLQTFPEGQLVAVDRETNSIVGMAASLIISWDDYAFHASWRDFTASGAFSNHDSEKGRTLYGAEVMVMPGRRGLGIGKALYKARRELAERLGLLRIRAGARLRGYHRVARRMSAEEYVNRIVSGRLSDATLSFQLRQGFRVLGVVPNYLSHDPESLGWAAVIEWLNPNVASEHPRVTHDYGDAPEQEGNQRGTMPAHVIALGASGTPNDETITRASVPAAPGTTVNSDA